VHRAVQPSGVRSRLDVLAATELTPFIGRDQELMLLDDRFAQVAEGNGQAVLIQGEAGIGKSRLVQAFRERIAERAHTWLECRGSAYTQDSAFYPVLELQRQGLAFRPDEAADVKLDRIAAGLHGVGFDPAETVPVIAALHGVPLGSRFTAPNLSPEGMRKKTFALLTEWLLRLGQRQPLALLMEDLHWMDPSTVELIGRVLEQVPTAPVLLLATYRPDFESPWGARSFLTPMLLSRFTRAQLADLVRKAARGRDLPDAWVGEILRRADGVPLFAEELTRTLLDQTPEPSADGALPLHIPETLQDSLTARLDALGPVKELAQVGSVLGREFSYDLLLAVSPIKEVELQAALRSAVREELFYQRGTPPEATYLFKHALIRDAAYQSMLRATRQRHHRLVAETLVERMPQIAETQPELVAQHWSEAGDIQNAIGWWQRAGKHSLELSANREAVRHFERGISLIETLASGEVAARLELQLQLGLGASMTSLSVWATDEAEGSAERSLALADDLNDRSARLTATFLLSAVHNARSELHESLRRGHELRDLGEQAADRAGALAGWHQVINGHLLLGELDLAVGELEQFLERYSEDVDETSLRFGQDMQCTARAWGAWALSLRGRPLRALQLSESSIAMAHRTAHPPTLCLVLAMRAAVLRDIRFVEQVAAVSAELVPLAEEQEAPVWIGVGRLFSAWVRAVRGGDGDQCVADSQAALVVAGSTRNLAGAPAMMAIHADTLRLAHRFSEARQFADSVLALSAQIRQPFCDADLYRLKGDLLVAERRVGGEAEAEYLRAIETARGQQAKSLELRAATSLARLWRDQGKRGDARDLLAPVYAWFTEGFDTLDLVEAKALLEELRD
jgi:predicted ATPase